MSKSPATTISDYIVAQTLGVYGGQDNTNYTVYTGREEASPDQAITVYDTGGEARLPAFRLNYPSLQIRVRGKPNDYQGAWTKLNDLTELLNGLAPQDLSDGNHWSGLINTSEPMFLQYDALSRPIFTANFKCFVEPAANSSPVMHRDSL